MSPATPQSIAIAIVAHHGRYLVGTRPQQAVLAGMAEFPGGKVHADESPAAAAARECLEETGLAVRVDRLRLRTEFSYPHGPVDLHFFDCTPLTPEAPPRGTFRWVERMQLASLTFPAANAAVVQQLCRE